MPNFIWLGVPGRECNVLVVGAQLLQLSENHKLETECEHLADMIRIMPQLAGL